MMCFRKYIVTLLLSVFSLAAYSQQLYNRYGEIIGCYESEKIYDRTGSYKGRLLADRFYDAKGNYANYAILDYCCSLLQNDTNSLSAMPINRHCGLLWGKVSPLSDYRSSAVR